MNQVTTVQDQAKTTLQNLLNDQKNPRVYYALQHTYPGNAESHRVYLIDNGLIEITEDVALATEMPIDKYDGVKAHCSNDGSPAWTIHRAIMKAAFNTDSGYSRPGDHRMIYASHL